MNTIDNLFRKDALSYHAEGRPGKLEVIPSKPYNTKRDLSLAYTPGAVSYTHLTLPTIYSVYISVGAVSLKKKKKYIQYLRSIRILSYIPYSQLCLKPLDGDMR